MPAVDSGVVNATSPTLHVMKRGFVIGNDVQFQRTASGYLPGDLAINGWLTIKSSPEMSDVSGAQVPITLVPTAFGVITNLSPTTNLLVFNLLELMTLVFFAGPLYYYDIKVQVTPGTYVYTLEQGWIQFLPQVGDKPAPPTPAPFLPPVAPRVLFGPNPPPAGPQLVGTRYWVDPPVEGFPAEWVCIDASGLWRVTSVVSLG